MPKVISLADRLSQMLAFVGAIGVVVMMIHVCADIVARLQEATPPAETEEESQQFVDDLIAAVRRERSER